MLLTLEETQSLYVDRCQLVNMASMEDFACYPLSGPRKKTRYTPAPKLTQLPINSIPSVKGKWVSTQCSDGIGFGFYDININQLYNPKEVAADRYSPPCLYTIQVHSKVTFRKQTPSKILKTFLNMKMPL